MGHKVNPKIFRIPVIRDWESKWFAKDQKFRQFLKEDVQMRKFLAKKFKNCGISKVIIERSANIIRIIIHTAKPGLIIGKGGIDIEKLKTELKKSFIPKDISLEVNVLEEGAPMLSAACLLETAIAEVEKRTPVRRVMKKTLKVAQTGGALGAKIVVGGRLGGAEIARVEKLTWGKLPLHTLRADIDYSRGVANTLYGAIGIKVWVYKGLKF